MKEEAYKQTNDTSKGSRRIAWVGYAASVWGMYFAAAHVYWACGGTLGLPPGQEQIASAQFAQNPWSFVISWGLLSVEFAILALFPLALVWQWSSVSQRRAQMVAIVSGYVGMILFAIYSFATHDSTMGLTCGGICLLGFVVARVRSRTQSATRWMVYIATWLFGIGMTLYGCGYIIMALLHPDTPYFLAYLFAGGMNWLVEGILFIATAILAQKLTAHHSNQRQLAA